MLLLLLSWFIIDNSNLEHISFLFHHCWSIVFMKKWIIFNFFSQQNSTSRCYTVVLCFMSLRSLSNIHCGSKLFSCVELLFVYFLFGELKLNVKLVFIEIKWPKVKLSQSVNCLLCLLFTALFSLPNTHSKKAKKETV